MFYPEDYRNVVTNCFPEFYKIWQALCINLSEFFNFIRMTPIAEILSKVYGKYFKITIRYLIKKKLYTIIHITGMSAAFAAVVLISDYILYEYKADTHFSEYDNLYRLNRGNNTGLAIPMMDLLTNDFTEFEDICRIQPNYTTVLSYGKENFTYDRGYYADPAVLAFFDMEVVQGDAGEFSLPGSIFISERLSRNIFGKINPIGESLEVEGKYSLTVKGVFSDLPNNSHLRFDYLIPIETMKLLDRNTRTQYEEFDQWGCTYYVLIRNASLIPELDNRLNEYIKTILDNDQWELHIQAFPDIYFNEAGIMDRSKHGNKRQLSVLSLVAIGIILLSIINYFNLSTANAFFRSKEIGIQKTFGVPGRIIAVQFLFETLIIVFLSLIIGLVLAEFIMPFFNQLYDLDLQVGTLYQVRYLVLIILTGLIIGLFSGFYPAIILSGIRVTSLFQKSITEATQGKTARTAFIVIQYTISITLLISVLTIQKQVRYMVHRDPGFEEEYLVYFSYGEQVAEDFEGLKDALLKIPSVSGLTQTANIPGKTYWNNLVDLEGERLIFFDCIADPEFARVMGIEMVKGEFIDWKAPYNQTLVINESAQRLLELDEPIGYTGIWGVPIVGVIRDFHYQSMHSEIQPLMIRHINYFSYATLRLEDKHHVESIRAIKKALDKHFPDHDIELHFFEEEFEKLYQSEKKLRIILTTFTVLAILISCIGLFGLTAFYAESYKKTSGIRIVFGANRMELLRSYLLLFLKWQVLGVILGIISSIFVLDLWLNQFAYRIHVPVGIMILAVILLLLISLVTILYHAVKVSGENPVEVLRNE
jgi:putative ABC transport system permease protein